MPEDTAVAGERWLPVVGWEGYYAVSDRGRVRSLKRVVICSNGQQRQVYACLLKQTIDTEGRLRVSLAKNGRCRRVRVHHLVLEAFTGPRPSRMYGCHSDGNCLNNDLANLRWDTPRNNQLDSLRHGTNRSAAKTACPGEHLLAVPNLVPREHRKGHRSCLACSRAFGRLRSRAHEDFKRISDQCYAEIMKAAS